MQKTQVFLLATRLALQERPCPKQPKGNASRQVISASVRRAHEMLDEAGPALQTSRDLGSRTGRNQLIRAGSFDADGTQAHIVIR